MAKIISVQKAVDAINDGDTILASGFYGNGTPEYILDEIIRQKKKDLSIINNDGNTTEKGVGRLIDAGLVKKFICTWCGRLPLANELANQSKMELEICPQGTFAERIRAGGYGLGGVVTPTGLGTIVEENGGQRVTMNGRDWLYHTPLRGNVAIIEAHRADTMGNLVFHLGQRNFGPVMCFAADLVIVEVQTLVEPAGSFHPDEIHVPGIMVDMLVHGKGVTEIER
jgi:acetate CoA/acetoacetate CoA-transferase alpha subunit